MKRFIIALLVIILTVSGSFVCAESIIDWLSDFVSKASEFEQNSDNNSKAKSYSVYDLEDLSLQVILPADLITFSRNDSDDDNADFVALFGLDGDLLYTHHVNNHVYLEAADPEKSFSIMFSMMEDDSGINDYNLLDDNQLDTMVSIMESVSEKSGIEIVSTEIYDHLQARFIKIKTSQPILFRTNNMIHYSTIFSGKNINIKIESFNREITEADEIMLKEVIDSIRFKQ